MALRIVIADDHRILREGLRSLLNGMTDIEVVGEADNGESVLSLVDELQPDIVIMDICMPSLNGIEATKRILRKHPKTRVIALSMFSDKRLVHSMLRSGALGYLLKECAYEDMLDAIRHVKVDRTYVSPRIAELIIRDYSKTNRQANKTVSAFTILSSREREILQLLAEGNSTREIADHLKISVKTVETHRHNIMIATGTKSIAELTKYAIREGLTGL